MTIVRTPTSATGGITDEERVRLAAHADKWIKNALRTDTVNPLVLTKAIEDLYAAAGLKKPKVVIVQSPLVMAIAGGLAAAVIMARKNQTNPNVVGEVKNIDPPVPSADCQTAEGILDGIATPNNQGTSATVFGSVYNGVNDVVEGLAQEATIDSESTSLGSPYDPGSGIIDGLTAGDMDELVYDRVNDAVPLTEIVQGIRDTVYAAAQEATPWDDKVIRTPEALSSAVDQSVDASLRRNQEEVWDGSVLATTNNTEDGVRNTLQAAFAAAADATPPEVIDFNDMSAVMAGKSAGDYLTQVEALAQTTNPVNEATLAATRFAVGSGVNETLSEAFATAEEVAEKAAKGVSAELGEGHPEVRREATDFPTMLPLYPLGLRNLNEVRSAVTDTLQLASEAVTTAGTKTLKEVDNMNPQDNVASQEVKLEVFDAALRPVAYPLTNEMHAATRVGVQSVLDAAAATHGGAAQKVENNLGRAEGSTDGLTDDDVFFRTQVKAETGGVEPGFAEVVTQAVDAAIEEMKDVGNVIAADVAAGSPTVGGVRIAVEAAVGDLAIEIEDGLNTDGVLDETTRSETFQASMAVNDFDSWEATVRNSIFSSVNETIQQATSGTTAHATEGPRQQFDHATDVATDKRTWAETVINASEMQQGLLMTANLDPLSHITPEALATIISDLCKSFNLNPDFARACIERWWNMYQGGNMWSAWASYLTAFRDILGLELPEQEKHKAWEACAIEGGFRIVHEDFCIVSDRPEILTIDNRNRPHGETGPSHRWRDGWELYYWHGVRIPQGLEYVVTDPSRITIQDIEEQRNSEVRRVLMERYGLARYVVDSGAKVVDELPADHPIVGLRTARLLVKEVEDQNNPVLVYVDLLNSTPEPDGSVKRYMLRVDPDAYDGEASRNAQAAAASTWRDWVNGPLTFTDWRDYAPIAES